MAVTLNSVRTISAVAELVVISLVLSRGHVRLQVNQCKKIISLKHSVRAT